MNDGNSGLTNPQQLLRRYIIPKVPKSIPQGLLIYINVYMYSSVWWLLGGSSQLVSG